jgi:hypothetical protein
VFIGVRGETGRRRVRIDAQRVHCGQRWEGLVRDRSVSWRYGTIYTEANLPRALAWLKATSEARQRAVALCIKASLQAVW